MRDKNYFWPKASGRLSFGANNSSGKGNKKSCLCCIYLEKKKFFPCDKLTIPFSERQPEVRLRRLFKCSLPGAHRRLKIAFKNCIAKVVRVIIDFSFFRLAKLLARIPLSCHEFSSSNSRSVRCCFFVQTTFSVAVSS